MTVWLGPGVRRSLDVHQIRDIQQALGGVHLAPELAVFAHHDEEWAHEPGPLQRRKQEFFLQVDVPS